MAFGAWVLVRGSAYTLTNPRHTAVAEQDFGTILRRHGLRPITDIHLDQHPDRTDFSNVVFGIISRVQYPSSAYLAVWCDNNWVYYYPPGERVNVNPTHEIDLDEEMKLWRALPPAALSTLSGQTESTTPPS